MFGPGLREEIKFFQESGIFRFVRKHFKIKLILVEVGSRQIVNPGLNLQLVYWLPQKKLLFSHLPWNWWSQNFRRKHISHERFNWWNQSKQIISQFSNSILSINLRTHIFWWTRMSINNINLFCLPRFCQVRIFLICQQLLR